MKNPFIKVTPLNAKKPIFLNSLNIVFIEDERSSRAIGVINNHNLIHVNETMIEIEEQIKNNFQ